jgi:colanic acid biosynthesis glycosyl transferase WcaI
VHVTRVPVYVPRRPTGLRRVLHLASFAVSAFGPALLRALCRRPDLVLAVAPTLLAAPVALAIGRLLGARTWLHVQDLELEAAAATGLAGQGVYSARFARALERQVIDKFDRVSAISPEMVDRLAEKGMARRKLVLARNWADPAVRPFSAASPLRSEWGITTEHVALYSGALGRKQGAEIILDVARRLKGRLDLTFVVCSDGPEFDRLRTLAADLPNLRFKPLQPPERLNALLNLATVHLLPQISGVADLVLPSKLANMLASGRPVVATAAPETGIAREVDGCGLTVEPGDAVAFSAAIERLIDDALLRRQLGRAAHARAQERWQARAILEGFVRELEASVASRAPEIWRGASNGSAT